MLFSVSGVVVRRSGRGTKLGFPTVNVSVTAPADWPYGSYAGYVLIEQQRYPAAIYYGPSLPVHLEAYLLDFSGNVYNQLVTIEGYQLIRLHEPIFDQTSLIQTIQSDINLVRQCLAALPKPA